MTPEEVYQFYGGVIKAAEAVNVSRQTFHRWLRRGVIPPQQQARYEKLSKKKLKVNNSAITDKLCDSYFPRFRYYSEALGMCDVHSLTYLSDRSPRIMFYSPENRQLKMASFKIENLMQELTIKDSKGTKIFEKDILLVGDVGVVINNILDFFTLDEHFRIDDLNEAIIVGNTFEGGKDGD